MERRSLAVILPSLLRVTLITVLLELSLMRIHMAVAARCADVEELNPHFCSSPFAPMAFFARQCGVFALQHKLTVSGMIESQSIAPPILQGMTSQTILISLVPVWISVTTDTAPVLKADVAHPAISLGRRLCFVACFARHMLVLTLESEVGLVMIESFRDEIDEQRILTSVFTVTLATWTGESTVIT